METGYEDEDDTHYCIKCHVTITGLDNYVQHRQTGCRQSERKTMTPEPPPAAVCYPEILNADAFFSSLELQSSAKTKSSGSRALEPEKKSERLGGKRKRTKRYHEIDEPSVKEKLIALSPVVTDLDDPTDHIGIPSLVGFPDLVPFTDKSTTSKLTPTLTKPADETDKNKRNDDRWLDDDLDEDSDTNKDSVDQSIDSDSDYNRQQRHSDDDSDESPAEDVAQEDSYSETDDPDDREYPPQPHTGGKWKPEQLLEHIAPENEDEVDQDDPDHRDSPVPQPHTGGKWKPSEQKTEEEEPAEMDEKEEEDKESVMTRNSRQPPPGHTRGKWIPGASVTPSELRSGYWCSPCGRKLASKLVYSRHLRSDLHARRSIQEIEGDVKLPRSVGPLLRSKSRTKRQKVIAQKRSTENKKAVDDNKSGKKTRNREKEILRCEMCHARVRRLQLGKHLLSHYHCRVAGLYPCSPKAQRFILENMGNVVRQCPFRCTSCRFYCNTQETFLRHWRSTHANMPNDDEKNYTCVCCNFWCNGGADMEQHLLSIEHRETVSMINGSVPIVIRRQLILSCETCNRRFRYNIQLQQHAKETGHPESSTAKDDYQQRVRCALCPQVLRSQVALQRHQLASHKSSDLPKAEIPSIAPYFCSFCSINFKAARDAILHRRTPSHKQTVKEHKFMSEGVLPSKDCGQCGDKFNNLTDYKRHLLQIHPDSCHKCLRCGEIFALAQDITKHTKEGACGKITEILDNESRCVDEGRKCLQCPFRTNSEAELIFHQALHAGTVQVYSEKPGSSKSPQTYRCPVCQKIFPKFSLRYHIFRHTREKPYRCSKCTESFSRKSALTFHITESHSLSESNVTNETTQRQRNFICLHCNTGFYTKNNLRQHMLRHVGKEYNCEFPDCPTVLRTETELRAHRALVHSPKSTERKFHCNECSYSARTKAQLRRHHTRHRDPEPQLSCSHKGCRFVTRLKSHLKRHLRLHTGAKPYKCPHCPYASNNIENLRKHVLSTRLHPGKKIYECEKCKIKGCNIYATNFSKELRAHLVTEHSEEFPTPGEANSYVAGMFASDGHPKQPE
ncbi:zinc finger protein 99 isoform X1 [Microplitis demolitor]|uniref:zinc finger protein 99 isoform X1 n=1 Tax=Microplitis demolitor TaxID=69319 RepID=UPI0004CD61B4|nr:zinc finger protein 99 isoform X1 [Microplitis demolitor]